MASGWTEEHIISYGILLGLSRRGGVFPPQRLCPVCPASGQTNTSTFFQRISKKSQTLLPGFCLCFKSKKPPVKAAFASLIKF